MFNIMDLDVEEAKINMSDYSWTIYGIPGIGKSTLAACLFADPAFFQFEKNQAAIKAKKIPVADWKNFKEYTKILKKAFDEGKEMPFKTAIIDTIDFCYTLCQTYICKANGWTSPADGAWGSGWQAVSTELELEMNNLESCGIKIVYIGHSKDKEFKPKNKDAYNQIVPSVPQGCLGTIIDKVNFVVYCNANEVEDSDGNIINQRKLNFRATSEYTAKCHLRYMPDELEFGVNAKETAEIIKKAFIEAIEKEFSENETAPDPAPKKQKKEKIEKKTEVVPEPPEVNPIEEEELQGTETGSTEDNLTLDQLKKKIEETLKARFKAKTMTPQKSIELLESKTGKRKITEINDIDKAKELLEAIKK